MGLNGVSEGACSHTVDDGDLLETGDECVFTGMVFKKDGEKIGEKLGEVKALYFYMKKTPDEIGKIINMNEAEVMSVIKEIEKRKDI